MKIIQKPLQDLFINPPLPSIKKTDQQVLGHRKKKTNSEQETKNKNLANRQFDVP